MISIALLLMTSTIYAVSSDCPNMIELARGLGMKTARPDIWTALHSDCCTATSITCDGSLRVYRIHWDRMGLNGTINGTAIPSSVTLLYIERNQISGPIPNALPSGLLALYLDGNQMSGDLPSFPDSLQYLFLGWPGNPGNRFTGSLRLNQPFQLHINENWITDVVIQDSSVLRAGGSDCDLSNNPLLGNPNIAGLTMCTKNGLYSAVLLSVTWSTKTATKSTTSVLGTTQLESPEMTSATTFEFPTTAAMQTVPATTAMKGMHITSSRVSVTGTQISSLTSSLGTVSFVQEMSGFVVNLGMMVRCIVSAMILTTVLNKSPFKREIKKMRSKGQNIKTTTTSALEF